MGATGLPWFQSGRSDGFNPRARDGRDRNSLSIAAFLDCFNPRARDGRDIFESMELHLGCRFNPRARDGRDG